MLEHVEKWRTTQLAHVRFNKVSENKISHIIVKSSTKINMCIPIDTCAKIWPSLCVPPQVPNPSPQDLIIYPLIWMHALKSRASEKSNKDTHVRFNNKPSLWIAWS